MKQTLPILGLIIFLWACNTESSNTTIDCGLTQNSFANSNISQQFFFFIPDIIIVDDDIYSSLGMELKFHSDTLYPINIKTNIKGQNDNILFTNESIKFVENSTDILIWDGRINDIEAIGLYQVSSKITFNNSEFLEFEVPVISTNCEEFNRCRELGNDCDLTNCRYYKQQNLYTQVPICP